MGSKTNFFLTCALAVSAFVDAAFFPYFAMRFGQALGVCGGGYGLFSCYLSYTVAVTVSSICSGLIVLTSCCMTEGLFGYWVVSLLFKLAFVIGGAVYANVTGLHELTSLAFYYLLGYGAFMLIAYCFADEHEEDWEEFEENDDDWEDIEENGASPVVYVAGQQGQSGDNDPPSYEEVASRV